MLQRFLNSKAVRWAMDIWDGLPDKLKVWIKGAVAVVEGAITAAVVQAWFDPSIHHLDIAALKQVAAASLTGAGIALRMYLRTSPLKPVLAEAIQQGWDGTDRRTLPRTDSATSAAGVGK
jgi:hypothetical protein